LTCQHCGSSFASVEGLPLLATSRRDIEAAQREPSQLHELWSLMETHPSSVAADLLAKRYHCSTQRFVTDWTFFLPAEPSGLLLELGAGLGDDTVELSRHYHTVVSLVPNLRNGLILRKRCADLQRSNVTIGVCPSPSALPLPSRSASVITLADATLAGLTPRSLPRAAAEWRRVLAPNGVLFLGIHNRPLGFQLLRPFRRPSSPSITLHRMIRKAAAGNPVGRLGLHSTIRCLRRHGFAHASVYEPLPNAEHIEIVIPMLDAGLVRFCTRSLLRQNSWVNRIAGWAADSPGGPNLIRRMLPSHFIVFTGAEQATSHSQTSRTL
jgi:SAM-dependent methyltransferase